MKDKRTGRDAVPNPLRRAPKLLLTKLTDFGVVGGAGTGRQLVVGGVGIGERDA
jgi:hypothetical protein